MSDRPRSKHPIGRPWRARVRYRSVSTFLGWYATEAEARAAEVAYMQENGIDNSPSAVARRSYETRKLLFG